MLFPSPTLGGRARGLLGVYVPSFIMAMGHSMAVPAIPVLATTFEVAPGFAAQIITAQVLGRILSVLPAGVILDRFGARTSMLLGASVVAAGSFSAMVAPAFVFLLAAQFLGGAGASLWQLGREVTAIDLVRSTQRGRAMSGLFGVSSAGVVVGPLAGGFLVELFGFRTVFLVHLILATFAFGIAVLLGQDRPHVRTTARPAFTLNTVKTIAPAFRATYFVLILATFAAMVRQQGLNSLLPLLAGSQLGLTTTEVGALFGLMGITSVLMIAPAGFLSDHVGRKAACVPAAVLSAISFVGYPFASDLLHLSLLSAISGIANGLALGAMTTFTYDIAPSSTRGQLQSFRRAAGEVGGLVGPGIGGFVAAAATPGAAFLFFAPLHLLAAILLAVVARESLVKRGSAMG